MNELKKYLCLISVFTLFVSCTEEISEEVKNGTNLTEEQEELVKFENKYLRIKNTSDPNLGYVMHKTGTIDRPCELKSPKLGFSSLNYKKDSALYTVDCILDTKEFDLFFSGASFEVQIDENMCEYVGYKPYKFFQYLPGNTVDTQYQINCDATCGEQFEGICGKTYKSNTASIPSGTFNPATISTYFQNQVTEANPLKCVFDYRKNLPIAGPNCDQGKITTIAYTIEAGTTTDADGNEIPSCVVGDGGLEPKIFYDTTSEFKCGGKRSACLAGPGADLLPEDKTQLIYQNLELDYFAKKFDLPSPISKGYFSNVSLANFSRICSDTSSTKIDNVGRIFSPYETVSSIVGHEVEDLPSRKSYNSHNVDSDGDGEADYRPYGRHLFDGSGYFSTPTKSVQPYYAIYCLDKARDVKAQMRLFIREWDRDFEPNNPYLAKISDIHLSYPTIINATTPSLMDAIGEQEAANDDWNDYWDIDDLLGDYDRNPFSDYDGDGGDFDNVFQNNSCNALKYGFCRGDLTKKTQPACEAVPGAEWRIHSYCSNDSFQTNASACIGGGGSWIYIENDALFPGMGL